jgi:hypothetical protein
MCWTLLTFLFTFSLAGQKYIGQYSFLILGDVNVTPRYGATALHFGE